MKKKGCDFFHISWQYFNDVFPRHCSTRVQNLFVRKMENLANGTKDCEVTIPNWNSDNHFQNILRLTPLSCRFCKSPPKINVFCKGEEPVGYNPSVY